VNYYEAEGQLYSVSEAVDRIQRVLDVARDLDVPDFAVNAMRSRKAEHSKR
jgi:hypothetical protein